MSVGMPLIVALLTALAVVLFFTALWVLLQRRDPVEQRLNAIGVRAVRREVSSMAGAAERYNLRGLRRYLAGFGLGPRLALELTRADVAMTVAEFILIIAVLALLGFAIGTWRVGPLMGLVLAAILGIVPFFYLGMRRRRRLRAFTQQLPDMLTLLVGALRAGYGLNQALDLVVERTAAPVSTEIGNVVRAVNLGLPLRRALEDAVARIGSEDFNLLVVAINVHYETGGNLAETLEVISDTIRDRLRMLNEIRVLTAQQRFTGYTLATLPIIVGLVVYLVNPGYIGDLFKPGWVRILPITAIVMQIIGFLFIRRIVDIEV